MVLINNKSYDWSQVLIQLSNASLPFAGVSSIDYSEAEESEMIYGWANLPVAEGRGNITTEVSLTLHEEEVRNIRSQSPTGSILDLPRFDIIVNYLHPEANKVVSDVIKNCKFRSDGGSKSQNDKSFEVELDIQASHIEWGGVPRFNIPGA